MARDEQAMKSCTPIPAHTYNLHPKAHNPCNKQGTSIPVVAPSSPASLSVILQREELLSHLIMQVLCCKPGYGALMASPVAGRGAWIRGEGARWAQRVRIQHAISQDVRYRGTGTCRAGLEDDAPFALAIAASVLSTLVLPADTSSEEGNETSSLSPLGGDDVRYAAMGIISFIPLFNWLVWVFAWLDTRKQRYLIYAIVYLAPYLRSGLSISPEDSWLPIASVLACILHVQLDISASSESGDDVNISKTLFTASQVKQMKERADTLLLRLQQLAQKPKPIGERAEEGTTAEDITKAEMEQWDEKFAQSKKDEKVDS